MWPYDLGLIQYPTPERGERYRSRRPLRHRPVSISCEWPSWPTDPREDDAGWCALSPLVPRDRAWSCASNSVVTHWMVATITEVVFYFSNTQASHISIYLKLCARGLFSTHNPSSSLSRFAINPKRSITRRVPLPSVVYLNQYRFAVHNHQRLRSTYPCIFCFYH